MNISNFLGRRISQSRWIKLLFVTIVLVVTNGMVAVWILGRQYDALKEGFRTGNWPFERGGRVITIEKSSKVEKAKAYRLYVHRDGESSSLTLEVPGQEFSPLRAVAARGKLQLASLSRQKAFEAPYVDEGAITRATRDLASALPHPSLHDKAIGVFLLRPFLTGVRWGEAGLEWKISTSKGPLWIGRDALPLEANLQVGNWRIQILPQKQEESPVHDANLVKEEVPEAELSACVAEAVRIVATLVAPPPSKADEIRCSGAGWLEVRDGHTQMFLEGTSYEIGHQHGSLDPEGVKKVCRRLAYGVGLLYSLKKGEWFPKAARELVERQRPFIAPAYFEEMRGLADGAGLPLDLIRMANIFPEFFHCSGVALMGEATAGGELLHARVLDYMVGIGLQDHAAVMAITRPGVNRFVTVGYLGFIGSVTGMNEKQVAIGEMGGDGQGDWDGIPMSLLIRQALEECNTLQEVETFMRESPRTCEYYYVISDGKGPSALGVAATPKKFETFGPGVWQERLAKPVKDAVLLSGPGRYDALVERVQQGYGKITRDNLIEIIKRPVAMKSNLHNVIFQPQSLRLSVADATRRGLACDQAYRSYTWDDLFSAAPSR